MKSLLCLNTYLKIATNNIKLPCLDHNGEFRFLPGHQVFWNDTSLKKEDIFKITGLHDWGYFILDLPDDTTNLEQRG